jgi:hypothetical protein
MNRAMSGFARYERCSRPGGGQQWVPDGIDPCAVGLCGAGGGTGPGLSLAYGAALADAFAQRPPLVACAPDQADTGSSCVGLFTTPETPSTAGVGTGGSSSSPPPIAEGSGVQLSEDDFTNHGLQRLDELGLTLTDADRIINAGKPYSDAQNPGHANYVLGNIELVTNSNGQVVTLIDSDGPINLPSPRFTPIAPPDPTANR